MSLLTVDVGGASETVIQFSRAGHDEPRSVGTRRYAFAGNERSMIRAEPFIVPVVLANLAPTTTRTLRTLFASQARVVCAGDVFNNAGVPVLCVGEITDEMEVGGPYWIPTLTLRQVTASTRGTLRLGATVDGLGSATATINGRQRSTLASAGAGTTTVTVNVRSRRTATAAGAGSATATLHVKRKVTTSAAGRGTPAVTGTKIP